MKRSISAALVLLFGLFTLLTYGCGSGGSSASSTVDGGSDATSSGGDAKMGGSGKSFSLGGTVSGLSGKGLTLQNAGKTLAVGASGAFTFKAPVAEGAMYDVTIATQPSSPTQVCTVAKGTGTMTGNVTDVAVTCAASKFTISGTVIGLSGTGLVLQDNDADDLSVSANGAFTFATAVASGDAFSVTVQTQPTAPTQTCTITGGTGTVGTANVTDVMINCGTTDFVIGGTISGLGAASVVLQDNGGDNLTVTANGTFAFATPVASDAAYDVTVLTQPSNPSQTCVVSMATGTVAGADVTSVSVVCATDSDSVGGTVTGLAAGASVVLQDNGGDNLTVSANGSFTFATPVTSGDTYAVTVLTQPTNPTQTCVVTNDTGTVGGAAVTNVTVTCTTSTYTIGGTLTGLGTGDSVTLEDNGGDDLAVTANGAFTFATPVASGASFNVTVVAQPGAPAQTCTASGGMGTVVAGNVSSVTVNCTTNTYTIGGTITGLAGTLVLQDNGGDNLSLTMNGTFAFATPLASGLSYTVSVLTQPSTPSQTCTVTMNSGAVTSANVTSVAVTCTTNTYTVGGTVTGLASGDTLVVQDNGADNLTLGAGGSFTFVTPLASGTSFSVTILSASGATAQTCGVTGGTGTVGAGNVTSVAINCATNQYTVGGTISGLAALGLVLQDNGGDNLAIAANGSFAFPTPIASGRTYSVTVLTSPSSPSQRCVVTGGAGTVGNANVTSVVVTCTTDTCPASTISQCVLTTTNSGSADNGACAAGYAGSCAYSCSLGTWTEVTNTCVLAACSSVAGPALTENLGGWTGAGLAFHALATGTLQSFVFNNQGLADTVTLLDVTANATVGTLATPAGNDAYTPTANWPLVSGHSYQLTAAGANAGSNGKWVSFTAFPVTDTVISVDGSWGLGAAQTQYWFTFTNLVTCD